MSGLGEALVNAAAEAYEAKQRVRFARQRWADAHAAHLWAWLHPDQPPGPGDFVIDPTGHWCLWQSTNEHGKQKWGYLWW